MPPNNPDDSSRTSDHVPSAVTPSRAETTSSLPTNDDLTTRVSGRSALPEGASNGVSVPGYLIEEVLGRGGMGVVYKAQHLTLKRTVALKMVLAGRHAGPHELARFRIEAEAVARLQHPNIVQIHDIGEADGHPFCALEFVEGGNLASTIDGHPIQAREAARLVETLSRAMQLAHSRNVVHRDLKPANILMAADGTPKITDFGLARQMDSDSSETQAGTVMGTPSYMAPEQAAGNAHAAGPAADVYALGAILYDCLTGRPPFKGKSVVETLDQVRTQEPVPPSRWHAGVPLDLETICLKCLSKEPEKRYPSAAELADDLLRYQHGEPILARPVSWIERTVKWVKRNPVATGAAIAVVLALAAGTTVSYLKYLDAEEQKVNAQRKEREAKEEAAKAERASEYLASIFELADSHGRRGTMTARQILDDAEKRIPQEFADQPELRDRLLRQIGSVFDKLTADAPLAMILEVSGAVQMQSTRDGKREAKVHSLLFTDDCLRLGAEAQVQLLILSDLHQERLQARTEATVRRKGCEPASSVRERHEDVSMTFVRLPRGAFYMGGGGGIAGKRTEIKEDFEIAVHLVTQGQWQQVMGNNPSAFSRFGPDSDTVRTISDEELKLFPVECVSAEDARMFAEKLNKRDLRRGWVYRLPTEAEWEYACRAGATTRQECSYHFYFDSPTNAISWTNANFNGGLPFGGALKGTCLGRPTRVGAYPPNRLGLCDMQGNLGQWCSDFDGQLEVVRGGAWGSDGLHCRAAERNLANHYDRSRAYGFRLVRTAVR